MARVCDLCGKRRMVGNNVSHAHNKTRRVFNPNLQPVRALIGKTVKKIKACTQCIRSGKVVKVS